MYEYVNEGLNTRVTVIEGELQDPIPRSEGENYNGESPWRMIRDGHPEMEGWQAAHLWGHGFGDEAAAGMMLAPEEVNQTWQNHAVEQFLREAHAAQSRTGGKVLLTARGVTAPLTEGGGVMFSQAEYTFSLQ